MDPDLVRSTFIWVRGSGSRGIKLSEKQSLTNKFLGFFCRKLYFSSLKLKKRAYLEGKGTDLKILFFFLTFKRWFEINLVIFCPVSGSALTKLCGIGSLYD